MMPHGLPRSANLAVITKIMRECKDIIMDVSEQEFQKRLAVIPLKGF